MESWFKISIFQTGRVCALFGMLLLLFSPVWLSADIIHLKNGRKFEGYFEAVDGKYMIFKTVRGKTRRVPANQVKRMDIFYSGVEVCYRIQSNPEEKNCSAILHSLSPEKVVLASADRKKKLKELKLTEFIEIVYKSKNGSKKILPFLKSGVDVELKFKKDLVSGRIASNKKKVVVIETYDGQLMEIAATELKSVTFRPPPPPPVVPSFELRYYIPGVAQFERKDYLSGFSILGGFAILAGGGYSEYRAANEASRAASQDPLFLLYDTGNYYNKFKRHQNNQRGIGALALLLYLYQLYDVRQGLEAQAKPGYQGRQELKISPYLNSGFQGAADDRELVHRLGLVLNY